MRYYLRFLVLIAGMMVAQSLFAQTNSDETHVAPTDNESYSNENDTTPLPLPAPSSFPVRQIPLFQKGSWILSYGLGFGGIGSLFYALGYSRDPYKIGDSAMLYTLSGVVAFDYFFGDFFDLGAEITIGGNLNSSVPAGGDRPSDGETHFFLFMLGIRGFVHYSFRVADVYGGLSLGMGLTRQTMTYEGGGETLSDNRMFLGWLLRFGSRFPINNRVGMFAEVSFPTPWLIVGSYYRFK